MEFLDDIARRHAGSREELAAEILAQLPQDRHAVLALYRAYEETLRQPGTRLDENPPEPLGMIGRYERVPAERIQDALLRAQVRRRSAPALLRVLASYRRTGRLPKKAEVSLPADPYVPGQRLVYESDAKRRYVAVYSRGWPNERDRPPGYRIGYGLVVPGSTKAHRDPKE